MDIHTPQSFKPQGFSLLELVVVLAGLGILSSLAIPNFIKILDQNNLDSAKATVNKVAAECLQKLRNTEEIQRSSVDAVDEDFLDLKLIENLGFQAEDQKCVGFGLNPIDPGSKIFHNFGFTIDTATLRLKKNASSGNTEDSEASCKLWAGNNCTSNENLKKFKAIQASMDEAKRTCSERSEKQRNNPKYIGTITTWNESSSKSCPTSASNPDALTFPREGCDPGGCVQTTYLCEGVNYGTNETGYKACRQNSADAACLASIDTYISNNPKITQGPININNCTDPHYIANDKAFKDEDDWKKEICSTTRDDYQVTRKTGEVTITECKEQQTFFYCLGEEKGTKALMNACISENEEAECSSAITNKVQSGFNGEFTAKPGGPGVCSDVNYICNQRTWEKQGFEDSCKPSCEEYKGIPDYCAWTNWHRQNMPACKEFCW